MKQDKKERMVTMKRRNWLISIRNNKKLTQEEAAELANIKRSTYTKAELGYPVRVKTAQKIGSALGFNWTLFFDTECDEKGQKTTA